MSAGSRYALFLGLVLVLGATGMATAAYVPETLEGRRSALWGVGLSTFSGVASLGLKRWALSRSLQGAMVAVAVVFLLRLVLAAVGLVGVMRVSGLPAMAFIVGFFGEYFALQWIELAYVLVESKRRDPGGA